MFKKEEKKIEVGLPTDVKHVQHIGYDPEQGFQVENIPAEWKEFFKQAGVKKKDLQNPEAAAQIYQIMNNMGRPPTDGPPAPPMAPPVSMAPSGMPLRGPPRGAPPVPPPMAPPVAPPIPDAPSVPAAPPVPVAPDIPMAPDVPSAPAVPDAPMAPSWTPPAATPPRPKPAPAPVDTRGNEKEDWIGFALLCLAWLGLAWLCLIFFLLSSSKPRQEPIIKFTKHTMAPTCVHLWSNTGDLLASIRNFKKDDALKKVDSAEKVTLFYLDLVTGEHTNLE